MLSILDYGLGNVRAFSNIFRRLNIPFCLVSHPDELLNASKIIFPGVGSFDQSMRLLHNSGLSPVLNDMVLTHRVPILGICVGMQVMAKSSSEGTLPGLGWIDAHVRPLSKPSSTFPLPHMGWNSVSSPYSNPLFLESNYSEFYFLHSFGILDIDQIFNPCFSSYSVDFVSAFSYENIHGVQFHPEKSHSSGQQLLEKFACQVF